MSNFKIGDTVSFLNDVGTGKILEIISESLVVVETEDGFDDKYPIKELILVKSDQDYKLDGLEHVISVQEKINSDAKFKKIDEFDKKMGTSRLESFQKDVVEVDLHIEELIDSHRGMSNSNILQVQMANFIRELNVAIHSKAKKLVVIHGVGEGTLKSEIRRELYEHYPDYEYHDASYRLYGYGATEIILH
jgi:dsDNA-specific endonuclease/ATPase MutS2